MKKLLSIIFAFSILVLGSQLFITANAEELNSGAVTFIKSTENLQKLKSYKATQTISGNLKLIPTFNSDGEEVNGQFTIKVQSDIYNHDVYENSMSAKITGRVNINVIADKKPFEDLFLYFNGEIIVIFEGGIYLRLNQSYLKASGVPDNEFYQEIKKEMDKYVNSIKGQWIYFPEDIIEQGIDESMPSEFEAQMELQDRLREQLKSDGIVKTYKSLLSEMLISSMSLDINEEELEKIQTIIDRFIATDFFTNKTITEGYYKDFSTFVLSKRRIVNFIQLVLREFGETLDMTNLDEIHELLSKFYLSGAYHVDETHSIFDKFKLKFILHDLDELKMLRLISFSEISDINKIGVIKGPDEFTNAEELVLLH